MSEVRIPNIVRQRLSAGGAVGSHLDAELLTALAEQRLTGGERDGVLAHLARCEHCREVAAIAAPEQMEALPVAKDRAPVRLAWLRWAMPAAAAAVLIGAGALVLPNLMNSGHQQESVAKVEDSVVSQPKAAPPASTKPSAPASADSEVVASSNKRAPSEAKRQLGDAASAGLKEGRTNAAASPKVATPSRVSDDVIPSRASGAALGVLSTAAETSRSNAASKAALAQATPPPPPPSPVVLANGATLNSTNGNFDVRFVRGPAGPPQSSDGTVVALGNQPEKTEAAPPSLRRRVEADLAKAFKAKPSYSPGIGNALVAGGARAQTQPGSPQMKFSADAATSQLASWRIDSAGKLQRRAWGSNDWTAVQVAPNVTFLSVRSQAEQVWAGGSTLQGNYLSEGEAGDDSLKKSTGTGLLYHSTDGGAHWELVRGPWVGVITSIDVANPPLQSVVVHTASGDWQSRDGGLNWQKTR
jgi:hypothetical protein